MNRSTIIVIFIIVLAGAGGIFFFTGEKINFSKNTFIYKAVPVSSPFFFELNSAKDIPFDHPVIQELEKGGIGTGWFHILQKADSLIDSNNALSGNILNSPFILAFDFTGRNQLIPLIVKKTETLNRQNAAEKLIHAFYPPEKYSYSKKEYDKHIISEVDLGKTEGSLFFSFADDLLLICPNSIPIEQVIRQLNSPGILNDSYFMEVNQSAGTQGISFFVNHSLINDFFGKILNRTTIEKVDEFGTTQRFQTARLAQKFSEFAAWSELDFRFGKNVLMLNGISAADDSLNHFMSVFENQQPVRSGADEILPQSTSFYCSFSLSNKKIFFEKLENRFSHSGAFYHREERMKRFDQGMRTNIKNVFKEWVKDEIIVATTTIPVNPDNKTVYFILHTESRTTTEEQLKKLLATYAARSGVEPDNLNTSFTVDNEVHFPVYRFPYPSFPGLWMGSPFQIVQARFVTFYNNYMVFSNSEQGLHEYLRYMVTGNTLAKNTRYQQFKQNSSTRSNINVFLDVNRAYSYKSEIFNVSLLKQLENFEENLRKFGMINWQVQNSKNKYFNSLNIAYHANLAEEAQTTWQSSIGNNLTLKPKLVVNHNDVVNREIIFQDNLNMLHLVTSTGRVRWSLELPGPVLSEIYQIDYFKNGKLQFLFNTREKLYLIDQTGASVANFPVSLPSPATNGVSVFDYDNNRNYRYFLATGDRNILAYDYTGKIIQGWEFGQTDNPVTTPVQHFRVENKDYIVFKDKSRIYIQDRQGNTRVSTAARFENSNNPLILNLDGTPKIAATDTGGNVYYIYFDGKFEKIATGPFSENHFFTLADLNGNNVPDFVFADGSELTVLDEKGKKLFSKKMDSPIQNPPNIYTFTSILKKIGVVDGATNRIYLFNPDGKLHSGFPLQGNSEFTIGKLNDNSTSFNLVVGSEGGKLYNYTLH